MRVHGQGSPLMLEGFTDPVHDSQRIFRQILEAMSRPGSVVTLDPLPAAPAGLHRASFALCLALLDHDSTVWLDAALQNDAWQHLSFHTGAPLVAMAEAAFALIADGHDLPDLARVPLGQAEYPERGVTLIIQVDGFDGPQPRFLKGPGIDGTASLAVRGLDDAFWTAIAANQHRFPLGFDAVLVHDTNIVAVPRSTIVSTHPAEA
jgi:alpha-D-ribose 1-methylphosphonate 5-triphosphate synthase subunit PhnH